MRTHSSAARKPGAGRTAIGVLMALAMAACGAEDWQGSIRDDGTTVRIDNPADGLWIDAEPPRIRVDLEQIYGADDENSAALLGFVLGAAPDSRGNVMVLDARPQRLVAFADNGTVTATLSAAGEGPGELDRATSLARADDATFLVTNRGSTRLERWQQAGTVEATWDLSTHGLRFARLAGTFANHRAVLYDSIPSRIGARISVIETDGDGALLQRFEVATVEGVELARNRGVAANVKAAVDRLEVGAIGEYALSSYDPAGTLRQLIRRPVELPLPASLADGTGSVYYTGGVRARVVLSNGYSLAMVHRVADAADPDATARRFADDPESLRWSSWIDVFDGQGRHLLEIAHADDTNPAIGEPVAAGADGVLYTVLRDPFPQVRRYRISFETT